MWGAHSGHCIMLKSIMLKNAFKKYPPQNRTNVQIKGWGGQRPFEQCSKKLHFFERKASLILSLGSVHNHEPSSAPKVVLVCSLTPVVSRYCCTLVMSAGITCWTLLDLQVFPFLSSFQLFAE